MTTGDGGELSPGAARYLEAIFYIGYEEGAVRAHRLAEWLGVSAPTVSEALRRLERDGLLSSVPGRAVAFTEAGRSAAETVVRRHRIVEVWLTDQLGLDWVVADEEAHRIAHTFSDEVLERLHIALGRPEVCPHGNWIPGEPESPRGQHQLTAVGPGHHARVARISEVAEHEAPILLGRLHEAGITPGVAVSVAQVNPDGSRSVSTERGTEILDERSAAAVWVEGIDPGAAECSQRSPSGGGEAAAAQWG